MWDSAGSSSWSYDEYGRTTTATRVIDGRSYASDYTFDALDRVREMTYPDNETLTYSYQANTLLDRIQSSINSLDIVSGVVYKDIGLPVSYTLGSSPTTATQSFEYWKIDDAARSPFAAVKRIKLSKDSTDLVNREMQYDPVGNVTKIVDGVNSETVDYTYDDLDRLLTASVPTGESFAYDTIGNMTSKAGTTLDYGTTAPKHAVKSHGSTTYTYDANGSMTARGTQTIKYDPEQRPILVQDGTSFHRAAYDGDGVRRKRDDSNGTVHYLGGYERKLAGGSSSPETITKYYSASLGAMSRPVAFRRAGTLHWVGSDHLAGTIRVLDSSFIALDGMRYKPYGEDRDAGDALATDRKFTGQTEDEAAGLYWYASRAYDPAIGRFCSPDVVVPEPGNPQALNRYSYVYNNPLKFVDPSGHSPDWFNEDWREEFIEKHKREPTGLDIAYRYASMDATSRGSDWSVGHWVGALERAGKDIVDSMERALPSVSIDIVDIGGEDDATNKLLLDLGRTLDWADLTITTAMALNTTLLITRFGWRGLAVGEGAYARMRYATVGIDLAGTSAVSIADYRAGRTRISIGSDSAEFSVGVDTLASATTTAMGYFVPEVYFSTLVDVAQVAYTESRIAGTPGLSIQIKIEY